MKLRHLIIKIGMGSLNVQRMIRTIKEMTTSMLVQAGLLPLYWSEALATAVYLRNRITTKASLSGLTPYATLYPNDNEDQYSHLKPFGCLCYVFVPEEKQKNFSSKTISWLCVEF